jgi:ABC-type glycerol-3-phosphate transport system substrate-binding protein
MKNKTKKIISVLLVAVMAVASLSAAKKKKEDPYKNVKPQKDPETKKKYDFKGMEVIISDWWTDAERAPVSKQEEDQFAWREWTNNTYNVKVVQKACAGWGSNPQFVANFCVGGGDENYAFLIDGRSASQGVRANLFYDLSKIKSVNYKDSSKYDQGVVDLLKKGDSFFAFNWGKPEPREGMFWNKRLLQEAGFDPDLPYDLQKEGKWTWEKFEELLKATTRDTDNDGIPDTWGLTTFSSTFCAAALFSNGGSFIERDANGKYYNNAGSDKSMEAWNWCVKIAQNYQQPSPGDDANWDWFYTAFVNGEAAFLCDQEYNAQPQGKFSSMQDDFGFVCFPLGPSGDHVYKTIHSSNMCIIPSIYSAERAEKVAKAIDLWLEPVPGYDDAVAWKEGYYSSFRDPRAVDETLQLMMDTPNPRFDGLVGGLSTGDMIWGIWGGWATPEESYENAKNVWQGLIDDTNR